MNKSPYYDPKLLDFYIKTLEYLNIRFHNISNYLSSNNPKISYLKFGSKQMILSNGDWASITEEIIKSKLFFTPIDEHGSLCSFLALEDAIHSKLSNNIYEIFKIVIEKKLNINIKENDYYSFDRKNISALPKIAIYTFYKWVNLYNIITATFFSRNLISFTFSYNRDTQSSKIKFDYPLYGYLGDIKNNMIFGIFLEDFEIKLFKDIYKNFIMNIFEDIQEKDINIPLKSNKCTTFYTLIRLYLRINELLINEYKLRVERVGLHFTKEEITILDNLNNYIDFENNPKLIEKFEEIKKADNEAYNKELKIRKESSPNLLLLKDNIVEEKLPGIQDRKEIIPFDNFNKERVYSLNKLFEYLSDEKAIKNYKKSLREIMSLEKKTHDISIENSRRDYLDKIDREFKLDNIFYWEDIVLNIINRDSLCLCLWFNSEDDKYYFRAGVNSRVKSADKKKISKKINDSLNQELNDFIIRKNYNNSKRFSVEVRIVDDIEEATKITEKLNLNNIFVICIFSSKIPIVEDEVFDTRVFNEFFNHDNNLNLTRNLFVPNVYLQKRYSQKRYIAAHKITSEKKSSSTSFRLNRKTYLFEKTGLVDYSNPDYLKIDIPEFVNDKNNKSFIAQFIFYLVNENIYNFNYVMNWLAYFFNTLEKSNTALVLMGDKELNEEFFFNAIIKELFGSKYCTTICDEEYKKADVSEIVKNKIFFHVGNIDNKKSKFDNETLSKILRQLLTRESVKIKNKDEKVSIYGQTIITSNNAYEITKTCYSRCTVIKTNKLETILEKLEIPDESILETKIQEDLEQFSSLLSIYPFFKNFAKHGLFTDDREINKKENSVTIDENTAKTQINEFINAFKTQNIKYFDKVKELDDGKLYSELKDTLLKEEGFYIKQDLSKYFNVIYNESIEQDKLLKILKVKDDMFKQEIDPLKATNEEDEIEKIFEAVSTENFIVSKKKICKITNYTLAEDIIVPNGFILKSVSKKNRFNYQYENEELAKKMYKEYDKLEQEKKQKSK